MGYDPDGMSMAKSNSIYNVVIDHCSVTWGIDEELSVADFHGNKRHDITLHKCIIAQGLRNSTHPKGPHSMGTLLNDTKQVSIIGCLYAHNDYRNPRVNSGAMATVVNCAMYNTGYKGIENLKRMQVDTIDLFYAHIDDMNTPVEEYLEAFTRLKSSGKIRFAGASNFSVWRLEECRQAALHN